MSQTQAGFQWFRCSVQMNLRRARRTRAAAHAKSVLRLPGAQFGASIVYGVTAADSLSAEHAAVRSSYSIRIAIGVSSLQLPWLEPTADY